MNRLDSSQVQIIHGIPPEAEKGTVCAFDTEWFEMEKHRLHRPHGIFASMACTYDGKTVYYISDVSDIPEFLSRISKALWVGHNIAFDIRQLRMFANIGPRKSVWDTMLIDQIRFRGYYDSFGLNDLYRRYCIGYLDKNVRTSYEHKSNKNENKLSSEMIVYGALDVVATYQVAIKQREQIDDDDLWIWQNIERPFMWVLLDIGGVKLDVERWIQIAEQKGEISGRIWKSCLEKYGINIRSPKQILQFFRDNNINLDSTNVSVLTEQVKKHPIIKEILEYRKPAKGSSTYGIRWIDEYVEDNDLVYASWNQMGARSGRMSCSSPNLQNIPTRTEPVYRECFIAEDNHSLIISDWSSQEPRITAFFSQDEKLIDIFRSGKDIYVSVGYHVFDEVFDEKDPRRKDMKALVLGLTYGMTKYGLASKINVPEGKDAVEYAQHLIDRFMYKFPGVKKYIDSKIKQAYSIGYVTTIYGRKCWISPYEKGIERDAPNYPVQGSAADAMKLAAISIHFEGKRLFGYPIIKMFVHDELVCSVRDEDVDSAVNLINSVMVRVAEEMHVGIPAKASISIAKSWAGKS